MKRELSVALILLACGSSEAWAQDSDKSKAVKIGRRAPAKGQSCNMKLSMTMNSDLTAAGDLSGEIQKTKALTSSEYEMSVLAVKGGQVTGMLVHCKEDKSSAETPKGPTKDKSPITGRKFRLLREGSGVTAKDVRGNPLDARTQAWLLKNHKTRLRDFVADLVKVLPKRALKVGETFKLTKEDLKGLPAGTDLRPCSVAFKGAKDFNGERCAVFHIKAEGKDTQGGSKVSFKSREVQYVSVSRGWVVKQTQVLQMTTVTKVGTNKMKIRINSSRTYTTP